MLFIGSNCIPLQPLLCLATRALSLWPPQTALLPPSVSPSRVEGVRWAPSQCLAPGETSWVSALAVVILGQEPGGRAVCPQGVLWGFSFRQDHGAGITPGSCLPSLFLLPHFWRGERSTRQHGPPRQRGKACDSSLHFHPGMKGMIENICFCDKSN